MRREGNRIIHTDKEAREEIARIINWFRANLMLQPLTTDQVFKHKNGINFKDDVFTRIVGEAQS